MLKLLSSPTAEFHIRYDQRPGHLYAFVSGARDSAEVSRQFWTAIALECERRRVDRVLVEEDFPNTLSDAETFELITGAELALRRLRIAFVDRRADHLQSNLFGETVARNRGMAVKVFPDTHAAERWLQV